MLMCLECKSWVNGETISELLNTRTSKIPKQETSKWLNLKLIWVWQEKIFFLQICHLSFVFSFLDWMFFFCQITMCSARFFRLTNFPFLLNFFLLALNCSCRSIFKVNTIECFYILTLLFVFWFWPIWNRLEKIIPL